MKNTNTIPVRLSEVDFLISTYDNRPGLERLLGSILDKYPAAKITIADSDENMDRAYYKALRLELSLLSRMVVHHLPFKAPLGRVFNKLVDVSNNKYKLLLTDEDVISDETDIEEMVRVMRSNKTIGVVGGHINKKKESEGRKLETDEGDTFVEVKQVSKFMMITSDVKVALRFDDNAPDFALHFSNQAADRLPFKMVMSGSLIKSNKDYGDEETNEQSNGESVGETPGQSVPDTTGGPDAQGGPADNGSPSGQDEASKNPAPRGRQGRSPAGSIQRKNDK